MPSTTPITRASSAALIPMVSETRVPKIRRDSTSRPSASVPSQNAALGGLVNWISPPGPVARS